MIHYLAVNAASYSANTNREQALAGLEPTNGYSDRILPVTLYKIYESIEVTYAIDTWMPRDVNFSILSDECKMITFSEDTESPESVVILCEKDNTLHEVGIIDELGRLVEHA